MYWDHREAVPPNLQVSPESAVYSHGRRSVAPLVVLGGLLVVSAVVVAIDILGSPFKPQTIELKNSYPVKTSSIKTTPLSEDLTIIYRSALINYGDKNHDKSISAEEQDLFNQELFRDKSVTILPSNRAVPLVVYTDGKEVPNHILGKWINEFHPR